MKSERSLRAVVQEALGCRGHFWLDADDVATAVRTALEDEGAFLSAGPEVTFGKGDIGQVIVHVYHEEGVLEIVSSFYFISPSMVN